MVDLILLDPLVRPPIVADPTDRYYAPPFDLQSIGIGLRPWEQAGISVLNPGAGMNAWQMHGGVPTYFTATPPPIVQMIPGLYMGPIPLPGQER